MVAVGLGLASRGLSLDIVRYDGETDDRFMPGTYPSAPQHNPYFRFGGMDWSGVGWNIEDPRKSVAMVSPKHFVAAGHFAVSGHLAFMAPDGRQVIREVSGTVHVLIDPMSGLVSDLYLGELVEPIGPEWGIAAYPILNLATPDSYLGQSLLVYGGRPASEGGADGVSIGVNTFEAFRQDMFCEMRWYFDQDKGRGEARAESGDSGSPTFVAMGSELTLVGTHNAVGVIGRKRVTIDTFVPNFIGQIRGIVEAGGYSLMPMPEAPVQDGTNGTKGGGKGKSR